MTQQEEYQEGYQEEYIRLLSTMDWWYDRSDDHSVYTKGKMQWERICQLMKIVDKDKSIYKSYVKGK